MSRFGGIHGVVLLDGRGGSGADMAGLLTPLGLAGKPVAAPEAVGASWWPTSFLAPSTQMQPYVATGLDTVDAAVAGLGVKRDLVAVIGFSQGACLALEWAARRGAGIGSVIAFSGGLVGRSDRGAPLAGLYGHADKAFDYDTDLAGVQVVITCHEADPHIPLARARRSAEVMEDLGASSAFFVLDGAGHSITPRAIEVALPHL